MKFHLFVFQPFAKPQGHFILEPETDGHHIESGKEQSITVPFPADIQEQIRQHLKTVGESSEQSLSNEQVYARMTAKYRCLFHAMQTSFYRGSDLTVIELPCPLFRFIAVATLQHFADEGKSK